MDRINYYELFEIDSDYEYDYALRNHESQEIEFLFYFGDWFYADTGELITIH